MSSPKFSTTVTARVRVTGINPNTGDHVCEIVDHPTCNGVKLEIDFFVTRDIAPPGTTPDSIIGKCFDVEGIPVSFIAYSFAEVDPATFQFQ